MLENSDSETELESKITLRDFCKLYNGQLNTRSAWK